MNGLDLEAGAELGAPRWRALNHKIIGFMSEAHVKIIANVPRVTTGNERNGAIYKFWLEYMENFQPVSSVILQRPIKTPQAAQMLWPAIKINTITTLRLLFAFFFFSRAVIFSRLW